MTTHHWQIGPAKCRDEFVEAEILAIDMGDDAICEYRPILIRHRSRGGGTWNLLRLLEDGRFHKSEPHGLDIVPPKLTREQVACECIEVAGINRVAIGVIAMQEALDHYDKLRAEGRIP